jgi:hypothetical protein
MTTADWLQRMVDVANDYGVTHGLTVEQLLEDKPEVHGEVVRAMRRPHGNITQVFFYIFNTRDRSQEEIVGMTLNLNGL